MASKYPRGHAATPVYSSSSTCANKSTGIDYNISLALFFVSYAFCDPIVNAVLKRASPRVFFTGIMVVSGVIVTFTGLCESYPGLLVARFVLGIVQSGMFPGVNYYMSCWYTSTEIGLRSALFFSAAALAGSFSGLLAAAIAKLDKAAGLSGWSWIFILQVLPFSDLFRIDLLRSW